ncbi:hypothetical protein [Apilactobacillus xinyiensis]|uniref:Uncharacterized protein n=1 Tax=Apilactobacillus xinyiensis TaxID=2841032 RepID=A0ABT0I311_9LACO|nr:hypothetical protein [Apilactobacillus xinyiensis]MCK8625130.1 hypothetical protein [Apilactobacillus xinyiensis]MCL0312871.1 hypothetical protein [Apilactobacillus xinyiensis]MCL0319271.1 hypothetical protein [Apilactobacillus xinyiensis]MCL0330469.1 hypothetical protein [Apilactobacillus xinyiensis]
MRGNFIYINSNLVRNMVISHGINSADFVNGINEMPNNILLLNDDRENANSINSHTRFSTITGKSAVRSFFLNKQITNKKIIDFKSADDLDSMLDSEIASLLYLGHMEVPMLYPFSSKLQNRYIYMDIRHNLVKTFYRKFSDFNHVLDISLKRHLRYTHNGKRVFIRPLVVKDVPNDIVLKLVKLSNDGILIAFDLANEKNRIYHIPLFLEDRSEYQYTWNDVNSFYDSAIKIGSLDYDINLSVWKLNITVQFESIDLNYLL